MAWSFTRFISRCGTRCCFSKRRRNLVICPTGKSVGIVSSPLAKNNSLRHLVDTALLIPPSRLTRGAYRDRHGRGRGMRWTLLVLKTNAPISGRRSRVVLMPRRWHQPADDADASRRGWWQESPITRESTKEAVKTIAQGRPDRFGVPVVTCSCAFFILHARLRVRWSIRLSLRPLLLRDVVHE